MAATSKFDSSSSSLDGPAHLIGQRGAHMTASLERLGSFREAAENRVSSLGTSRTGSVPSQIDTVNLVQTLLSDLPMTVLDQLSPRPRELRRLISSIIGISQEDSLPAIFPAKPLPSSAMEEIRRLINYLQEGSVMARDRAKTFGEAALKMDKCSSNTSRKRSRTDIPSSERSNATVAGGSALKMGAHSHLTGRGLDVGPQKSEERAKSGAPSRKIRTSFTEMDARPNKNARPSASMDRDRDVLKLANSGATPPEEKGRALASAVDGWDNSNSKTKKKRSVIKSDASGSAVLARPHDTDRESKRGMQQKLATEARPRLNNTHSFRSGPANGITAAGKLDSASQPTGTGVRTYSRNDQDNGSLPNDRRDRLVGSDKEGATFRACSKPNGCEEGYAASPTSTMKMSTSVRGPRSNSGSLSKTASPNMNCAPGTSDDCEHPNSLNKLNGGVVNRKRSASARSSSPPVANWGGQRHQTTRVARRSNLPPVVSNCDDFTPPEIQSTLAVNDDGLGIMRRPSANASLQSKSRVDQLLSTGLSEGEEFGVVDNKSKDKSKKCNEMEEKAGASVQKVASVVLSSRRSKVAVAAEDDQEDSIGKHGKISRGSTPARADMPASNEKFDVVATAKQTRSARLNYEKTESKPGRPPTKKCSERKGHARPRHTSIGAPSLELAGESDDDHEELLAAANAALNTVCQACLPPREQDQELLSRKKLPSIWEQNEDIFGLLSVEDQEFLNEQMCDESSAKVCGAGNGQGLKDEFDYNSLPSTPPSSKVGYDGSPNGTISLNEHTRVIKPTTSSKRIEPFLEELVLANGVQTGISICQALLSAIIEEEDIEIYNHKNSNEEERSFGNAYGLHFEVDAELKSSSLNFQSFGIFRAADRGALYSYKANTGWGYHDELILEDLGIDGAVDDLVPSLTVTSSPMCTEFQYSHMCIDDRILLELSEIGVYPEPVPHLAPSEDEDIGEGINRLMAKLHEQVLKKKRLLLELEKVVKEARESQGRELERIALDKLVGRAYEKYMACWGPKASGSKNVNRNKQATLAFVQRTLARYQRFVETRTSCFSEPAFRDMFYSVSSNKDASKNAMNSRPFTAGRQPEISLPDGNHGQASQSAQRDYHIKYSDSFRSVNHLTEQSCGREDQWSNKLKKKELLLDEVVGSATDILRASSTLGSGTKGKRSERDREGKGQNRDSTARNSPTKIGRPSLSNAKGERKNKSKPKQKMTLLSTEMPNNNASPSALKHGNVDGSTKKDEGPPINNYNGMNDLSNDPVTIDFGDLGDFGGQGQDIGSWLNIEEDGLQDHDFMGLEIPMDDLSEVMF